jgi:hypothetical protein
MTDSPNISPPPDRSPEEMNETGGSQSNGTMSTQSNSFFEMIRKPVSRSAAILAALAATFTIPAVF